MAYWLDYTKNKLKPVFETLVSMPLVLPPTVLSFFGQWLDEWFGLRLVFSCGGLVIALVIYSFPFIVYPIQAGFSNLSSSLTEASVVLGKYKITA